MKTLPSRLQIALLSAGISGAVLAAFGVVMWLMIYDMRIEAVDRDIRTLGSRHPGLFAGRGNYDRLASSLEFTFGEDYTNHVILLLKDSSGRTFYTSPHWPKALDPAKLDLRLEDNRSNPPPTTTETNFAHSQPGTERSARGRGGWGGGAGAGRGGPPPTVVFTRPLRFFTANTSESAWRFGVLGNDEVTLVVGLNQREVEQDLNRVRNAFLLTLPVALFLVGLGGWMVAGRALRPLNTIADAAERVTAQGLDQRIPNSPENPEVARLIQVLNRMMDRLETSFRQATRFSADASHELKTPLAVMQGELENALQAVSAGSAEQQLFSNLLEEIQRLKTITRSLLLLAQADAGQLKLALEPVDLSVELGAMIEDARVLAADSRLHFEVEVQPQVRVSADRGLLHTAMFNLINNAIKYNEADGGVSIRLNATEHSAVFTIGNTGLGIPPEDQPRIFDRFFRGGRTNRPKVEGIGLGLSLAREIIRAHGGELSLKEGRADWTFFRAVLPCDHGGGSSPSR